MTRLDASLDALIIPATEGDAAAMLADSGAVEYA